MKIHEIQARMCENFLDEWLTELPNELDFYSPEDKNKLIKLHNRIAGKEVTLLVYSYDCCPQAPCYFEKEDDDFVIFPHMFERI